MICADTSFLLSLAGNDSNSPAATAHARTLTEPLRATALNRLEFENAIRLLRFRGVLTETEAAATLAILEGDESEGRIVELICDWPEVMGEAMRLSRAWAEREGQRCWISCTLPPH